MKTAEECIEHIKELWGVDYLQTEVVCAIESVYEFLINDKGDE